jgi:hypothetical protein
VLRVSPVAYEDERSGVSSYAVDLEITPEAIAALAGLLLVAGISVDAYLTTGSRSPPRLPHPADDRLLRAVAQGAVTLDRTRAVP